MAAGAKNSNLDALFDSGSLSGGNSRDAVVFGMFTIAAAFRRIPQVFVAEKNLFTDCPNKLFPAIDTRNLFIEDICIDWQRFYIKIVGESFLIKLF